LGAALKHPASLLILGFALTGVVGSWLNSCWHISEWRNQQVYLTSQQDLQRKYETLELLMKSTATYLGASRDVVAMAQWGFDPNKRKKDIAARIEDWEKGKRLWEAESVVIYNKLGIYFPGEPRAQGIFLFFIDDTAYMNPDLRRIAEAKLDSQSEKDTSKDLRSALSRAIAIEHELNRLGQLLKEDVQRSAARVQSGESTGNNGLPGGQRNQSTTAKVDCLEPTAPFK